MLMDLWPLLEDTAPKGPVGTIAPAFPRKRVARGKSQLLLMLSAEAKNVTAVLPAQRIQLNLDARVSRHEAIDTDESMKWVEGALESDRRDIDALLLILMEEQ